MARPRHPARSRSADPTPEGEALYELIVQLPRLYFQLRGVSHGRESPGGHGDGLWSLLRTLKLDGPRTVPQVARARQVARQRIQQLTDTARADGLVELRDNPDHRKSKLVALTREGEAKLDALDRQVRQTAERLAENLDVRDVDAALRVVFELRERLGQRR